MRGPIGEPNPTGGGKPKSERKPKPKKSQRIQNERSLESERNDKMKVIKVIHDKGHFDVRVEVECIGKGRQPVLDPLIKTAENDQFPPLHFLGPYLASLHLTELGSTIDPEAELSIPWLNSAKASKTLGVKSIPLELQVEHLSMTRQMTDLPLWPISM